VSVNVTKTAAADTMTDFSNRLSDKPFMTDSSVSAPSGGTDDFSCSYGTYSSELQEFIQLLPDTSLQGLNQV
jgi:hypothetical protein